MATLCAYPGPIFSLAATCRIDFNKLLARHAAKADVRPVRSFGKVIDQDRALYVMLAPGRHAALSKLDGGSSVEVALERVKNAFYEYELELVAGFIGLPSEYMERYRNPDIKWVSISPSEAELQRWCEHVGSPYPYPRAGV